MRHSLIDPQLFATNRKHLLERMPANTLSVLNANDLMPSNADGTLPYHPNSDLFYLSGIEQEESILVLQPSAQKPSEQAHLFIRKPNPTLQLWEGYKLNKTDARKISAISKIHWLEDFTEVFGKLAKNNNGPFYLNDNEHQRADNPVETRDQRFSNTLRQRFSKRRFLRLAPHLHALRFRKDLCEVDLIKQAVEVTTDAFNEVLPERN